MNHLGSGFRLATLALAIGLLSACSELQSLQERFAADPLLRQNTTERKSDLEQQIQGDREQQTPVVNLPQDFPVEIPTIPRAELIEANETGKTVWKAQQSGTRIFNFYQQALTSNGWKILQSVASEAGGNKTLTASLDNLEINISIEPEGAESKTVFAISYHRNNRIASSETKQLTTTDPNPEKEKTKPSPRIEEQKPAPLSYSDLDTIPEQLQAYVKEVIALGSIVIEPNKHNGDRLFQPNKTVTRREFARWLVRTNNTMYSHRPSQEVRLAASNKTPAFKDIPVFDPDFPYIQALAETGIVPSILTGDSSQILFRPDAPLTREDFIIWKLPLDIRRSLPSASIEAIEKTWGFEDTAQINSLALRALFADFQNGENSNLRRAFGYTILFQPNKTVTRAEAVASFWYFGYQGDGISAEEALKIQN